MVFKYLRYDNAGDHTTLEKMTKDGGLDTAFEYTTAGTPQQNARIKHKFMTIYDRVRTMLSGSGIKGNLKKRFLAEAADRATDLQHILVPSGGGY